MKPQNDLERSAYLAQSILEQVSARGASRLPQEAAAANPANPEADSYQDFTGTRSISPLTCFEACKPWQLRFAGASVIGHAVTVLIELCLNAGH